MRAESSRSRYSAVVAALAAVLGLGIGWLDLHTTEVVVTILPLLLAGLLLGLLQPTGAWRWALLLAVGFPAMAVVARLLGLSTAEPIRLESAHCPGGYGVRSCGLLRRRRDPERVNGFETLTRDIY